MDESGAPLERLAELTGRDFPHLFAARERTVAGLRDRRTELSKLRHDAETSVVLMGSWGRSGVTSESDDDFMILVHGAEGAKAEPAVEAVTGVLDHAPGSEGIFAAPVYSEKLVRKIGLDDDDNKNLSRRLLFLLESVPLPMRECLVPYREVQR